MLLGADHPQEVKRREYKKALKDLDDGVKSNPLVKEIMKDPISKDLDPVITEKAIFKVCPGISLLINLGEAAK